MSHAEGRIYKDNNIIGFYEYDGTADVVQTQIYNTREEMQKNWRKYINKDCTCITKCYIPVKLYTTYGLGFNWNGKVCLHCRAIVEGLMPFDEECNRKDGLPG